MEKMPNVIIILTDDQGYGDFSCHGNQSLKTPHVDKLFSDSFRFNDFHSAPMCTPTRAQLMSGCDAMNNKACHVSGGRSFLRKDMPTMADVFRTNGYNTGIFGKWHLGDNYPYRPEDRGFMETLYFKGGAISTAGDYWTNDYFDDVYMHNGSLEQYHGYCTDIWFEEAKKWIGKCHQEGKPFFTYIATNAPHVPLYVPEKYREPYRNHDIFLASFFGMIACIDENIGKLDRFLEDNALKEDTILIFMTDNGGTEGTDFFNAGMRGKKCSLYDGGHRVPCFIRWPRGGILAGRTYDQPAQSQDLLPTLMDLCAFTGKSQMRLDGTSLAPLLTGLSTEMSDRMLVVQYGEPVEWDSTVIWNSWRLVKGTELFNIGKDPAQAHDVSLEYPEVVSAMRNHYAAWWSSVKREIYQYEPIHIGPLHETKLLNYDGTAMPMWYQTSIRLFGTVGKEEFFSEWHILVEEEGEYEVSLRRWPIEADAPITGGVPMLLPHDQTFCHSNTEKDTKESRYYEISSFPAGTSLPVKRVSLDIGDVHREQSIGPDDQAATFKVLLSEGRAILKSSFFDAEGKKICSTPYLYIRQI